MAGHRPDRKPSTPGPRTATDSTALTVAPAGEPTPSGQEDVRWLDRFAWLALLPWGCSVAIVLALAWVATLASWRLQ